MKIMENCYTIRCAAGSYWLLDVAQSGVPYKKPLSFNEVGARIWEMLIEEYSLGQICKQLVSEYDADENLIQEDVMSFLNQLHRYGVKIEE